jgi:hypothetical protein
VAAATCVGLVASLLVGQAWITVDQGSFHLNGGPVIHTVTVDDMPDGEACKMDLRNPFSRRARPIILRVFCDTPSVLKDTVPLTFAHVEGLTVTGVDEPINVVAEPLFNSLREVIGAHIYLPRLMQYVVSASGGVPPWNQRCSVLWLIFPIPAPTDNRPFP